MAYPVCSLYKLCLCNISELLLKIQNKVSITPSDNPFSAFHPNILHDLMESTGKKAKDDEECFKSSYVYPLITTGRIKSFDLTVAYIQQQDAEEIFNDLQPYSDKLKSLKLNYQILDDCLLSNSLWTSSNLGTLLRSAKNLVSLQTSISFDLSELSHCENLEKLTLNFMINDNFSLLRVDDKIRHNHSLKMLRILNIKENAGLELEIAEILQYCVEIIEIDYDVSQSLVHLHKTKKATKYKLQKTLLGNIMYPLMAPAESIEIASWYCPDLRTVDASPEDFLAFRTLSKFKNITNLTLNDPNSPFDDFNQAVRPLLEGSSFSPNLKTLVLRYFSDLDVSCIGACCPQLKEFAVEYISENNRSKFTTDSFKKLESLFFKNTMKEPCREDSIIALLSQSEKLEFLTIDDASRLNDSVLNIILLNTKVFSKMKSLTLDNCGLTKPGLEKLAQSTISLERVSYSSKLISLDDIETIFRRYRPYVEIFFAEDDELNVEEHF